MQWSVVSLQMGHVKEIWPAEGSAIVQVHAAVVRHIVHSIYHFSSSAPRRGARNRRWRAR